MSNESKPQSLKIHINQPDPLDRANTYLSYIQTNHSGMEGDVVYTATGKEISEIIKNAMYHAHSNGRARERQLGSPLIRSKEG